VKANIRPRMLDINDTAEYLGLSPKTIRNRIGPMAENPFPVKPYRQGRKVTFKIEDLDAYIDSLPTTP